MFLGMWHRYEHMFDPEVARPLFSLLCGHRMSEPELGEVVAAWVGRRQERKSQVRVFEGCSFRVNGTAGRLCTC
jgi:hypothetical protein